MEEILTYLAIGFVIVCAVSFYGWYFDNRELDLDDLPLYFVACVFWPIFLAMIIYQYFKYR